MPQPPPDGFPQRAVLKAAEGEVHVLKVQQPDIGDALQRFLRARPQDKRDRTSLPAHTRGIYCTSVLSHTLN
jgi:hypothetical protein